MAPEVNNNNTQLNQERMAFLDILMRENKQSGQEGPQTHTINTNSQQPNNHAIPQTTQPTSCNTLPSQNIPQSTFQVAQNMQTQYHRQHMYQSEPTYLMPRFQQTRAAISIMSTQEQSSQQQTHPQTCLTHQ